MSDAEDGREVYLSASDAKRFMPEAILEESDNIITFDFPSIKMEEAESHNREMSNSLEDENSGDGDDSSSDVIMDDDSQIVIHMDIREPLTNLRLLLEEKLGQSLEDFTFSLQDTQTLEESKNLVDQCVQGEGIVQINCELKASVNYGKRINIVDVLKPAEEYVEILGNGDEDVEDLPEIADDQKIRWIVDSGFKKDQEKLGIPQDPAKWSVENVRHWLMWAVRQFSLSGIDLSEWAITGVELSKMTQHEFKSRVPRDPLNSFWTHFELLRKCKIVAVNPSYGEYHSHMEDSSEDPLKTVPTIITKPRAQEKVNRMTRIIKSNPAAAEHSYGKGPLFSQINSLPNMGIVGPVQLWQFLLDLLTNWQHRSAIQWIGTEGEFKLLNPELVAHLWGLRKNKPTMNYEKLSRALRYYYDGEMISKVPGKRFVYKFVCDLKQMIGYSASELNSLVIEAEMKGKQSETVALQGPIVVNEFITLLPE